MIWLFIVLFVISFVINVLFVLYIRHLFGKFLFDADSLGFIKSSLESLESHFASLMTGVVYSEDERIQALTKHIKATIQDIRIFKHIYKLLDDKEAKEMEAFSPEEDYDDEFVELDENGEPIEQNERRTVYSA